MKDEILRALGLESAISREMDEAITLWSRMFLDQAPWLDAVTQSCSLATAIAGECARLTVVELEAGISGGERARYLNREFQKLVKALRPAMELACATGGMVFKPYPVDGHLAVDCVPMWRFVPVSFNNRGEITAAVFTEHITVGRQHYTRLEYHRKTDEGYWVENRAFVSGTSGHLGKACPLTAVEAWAELEPSVLLRMPKGKGPEHMLFALFRVPWANHIDPDSPLGVSVYSRAVSLIREADRQYSRILWEYEGSELAIDASEGALRPNGKGVPKRKHRLFRELRLDSGDKDLYSVFSPQIRDSALFNGLNQILRRIEFNCHLAYGTISDPQNVSRTAEEIKGSKQRSFSAICELQRALEQALQEVVQIMALYCDLYGLAPKGRFRLGLTWGDGVQEDVSAEFERRKALTDQGYLRPEKLLAWYFHIPEEAVGDYLPEVKAAAPHSQTPEISATDPTDT